MATATMAEAAPYVWKPHHNPWAVALTVTLATFMEVLDTSIANVALPHIAGGLGAKISRDQVGRNQADARQQIENLVGRNVGVGCDAFERAQFPGAGPGSSACARNRHRQ